MHFYRNTLAKTPKRPRGPAMLMTIYAMESREAAKVVREGFGEKLTYCEMPHEHWRRTRTNNAIE